MERLPKWCLTNKFPALYDTESATVIEQTAKVYGAMNELIDNFNSFSESVSNLINEFETSTTSDIEQFKVGIRQEFQDFIDTVSLHIQSQDIKLEEYNQEIEQFKNDVNSSNQTFKNSITTSYNQFVSNVESQIASQDLKLDLSLTDYEGRVKHIEDTLPQTVQDEVSTTLAYMVENGDIEVVVGYDETNEAITLHS